MDQSIVTSTQSEGIQTTRAARLQDLREIYSDSYDYRGRISDLLSAIEVAGPFVEQRAERETDKLFDYLEGLDKPLTNSDKLTLRAVFKFHKQKVGSKLRSTIRASALILAHSLLDDSLNRLIEASIEGQWADWAIDVRADCKVMYSLDQVMNFQFLEERKRIVSLHILRLKKLSVPKRNDLLLLKIGKYGSTCSLSRMKSSALRSFDRKRHDLVHANVLLREQFEAEVQSECLQALDHVDNLLFSLGEALSFTQSDITEPALI